MVEPEQQAKGHVGGGLTEEQSEKEKEPEPVTGGKAPPPAQLTTPSQSALITGIKKETVSEEATGQNPKGDRAESERVEQERVARAQAEREEKAANAKTTLLTPPVDRPRLRLHQPSTCAARRRSS